MAADDDPNGLGAFTASPLSVGPRNQSLQSSQGNANGPALLKSDRDMEAQRAANIQSALNQRYGQYQQSASDVKQILDNAANTLRQTPVGPTPQEQWQRMVAGYVGSPVGAGMGDARMASAVADSMAATRQAQLEKQEMLAKYGLMAGQMGMQASQMGLNNLNSQENNAQTRLTSLDTAYARATDPNKLIINTPNGPQVNTSLIDAQTKLAQQKAAAAAKGRMDVLGGYSTQEALDYASDIYRKTGKIPVGVSRADPTFGPKVIALAAQKAREEGSDAQGDLYDQASYKAAQSAMGQLTKQQTMVGAFEKTAEKNLQLALSESEKVDRTGSPLINKAILAWKQGVVGDPETAGFVNALTTFKNEYAKVLSGATGASGITDAARREADDLFSKIQSKESLQYVANIARQEMSNRMSSFDDQQRELQSHLQNHTPVTAPATTAPSGGPKPTASDIAYLKAHPESASKFKAHFGALPEGFGG